MMQDLINKIKQFRDERNWQQFHTGENLAKSLVIEAGELLELYQWQNDVKDIEHLKEELADVLIYALLLADKYQLDIKAIIETKLHKNAVKYPVEKAYGNAKKYNEL